MNVKEKTISIRQEQPKDYDTVNLLVKTAFAGAIHSDGNEQNLVSALRGSSSFIPQLSLVAICREKIVGHILFSKAAVGEKAVLALAPLSVLPSHQRQGIGQSLIAQGHQIAAEAGYEYCVVLGHPQYYPKMGYRPASQYGIKAPFEIPEENFMAVKLTPAAAPVNGVIKYDPAFGI